MKIKKGIIKLLNGIKGSYLSMPNRKDWQFGKKDFTTCWISYRNKKNQMCIKSCYCKNWSKCQGFKYETK